MHSDAIMKISNTRDDSAEVGLLPVGTLVMWLGCVIVGATGLLVPYPWPHAPPAQAPPMQAQIMHVELTNDASPPPDIGPPETPAPELEAQPPAAPQEVTIAPAPALAAVAAPNPAIAFALPIEGSTRVTNAWQAIPAAPSQVAATQPTGPMVATSVPQRLTFGQGEGRQPVPEYPRQAALARQQGTVVVHFTVGEDGRVQTAQVISPSPYPLLNQAAVRAIRETWRFRAGPARAYEVSIQFELRQR